jgi:hypothetical protein
MSPPRPGGNASRGNTVSFNSKRQAHDAVIAGVERATGIGLFENRSERIARRLPKVHPVLCRSAAERLPHFDGTSSEQSRVSLETVAKLGFPIRAIALEQELGLLDGARDGAPHRQTRACQLTLRLTRAC